MVQNISNIFPLNQRHLWYGIDKLSNQIREIRIRVNQKVRIKTDTEIITDIIYTEKDMDEFFMYICHDSVYAYEEERKQGFITIEGGNRVGIAGEIGVTADGQYMIKAVRYINIRIAHEIKGISEKIIEYIIDKKGEAYNTLIISSPGRGKTTLLRDIVRNISDTSVIKGDIDIGVIDERGEIAGAVRGVATLDCGQNTDIITGGNKKTGINILIRTFSPKIIVIDEIGQENDAEAIFKAGVCGCKIIATIHGKNYQDVCFRKDMKDIIDKDIFNRFIEIYLNENNDRCVRILDQKGKELCGDILLQI